MDMLGSFMDNVLKHRYEEDGVDRLHYRYTAWLMLASAVLLSAQQYVGKPIQCWVPAQFRGGWEQYVEDYCFVENTYWLPFEQRIPSDTDVRDEQMLSYYQWVPFMLALQALMFNVPHILWRMLNWLSGLQVRAIVAMASDRTLTRNEKTLKIIAGNIQDGVAIEAAVSRNSNPAGWILRVLFLTRGIYVTTLYMLMKILNIVNLVGQFYLLRAFLGTAYPLWGFEIFRDIVDNRHWNATGHFPRVTLCDFEVRELGNIHRWSVQCVLMVNMFNEKIYLYLWWHMFVLAIATIINFLTWLFAILMPGSRRRFVEKLLNAQGLPSEQDDPFVGEFVSKRLRLDGFTVLRLVAQNGGGLVASDVVALMWREFLQNKREQASFVNANAPPEYQQVRPTSL